VSIQRSSPAVEDEEPAFVPQGRGVPEAEESDRHNTEDQEIAAVSGGGNRPFLFGMIAIGVAAFAAGGFLFLTKFMK
jgi:hypothetical protein